MNSDIEWIDNKKAKMWFIGSAILGVIILGTLLPLYGLLKFGEFSNIVILMTIFGIILSISLVVFVFGMIFLYRAGFSPNQIHGHYIIKNRNYSVNYSDIKKLVLLKERNKITGFILLTNGERNYNGGQVSSEIINKLKNEINKRKIEIVENSYYEYRSNLVLGPAKKNNVEKGNGKKLS
jgi:membrane-bound ClpP family serine protease